MKLHITITDNETGKVILSKDTNAIIGAIDGGEDGTGRIVCTNCDSICLAATAAGAIQSANQAIEDLPKHLRKAVAKLGKE